MEPNLDDHIEQETYVGLDSEIRQYMVDVYDCIGAMRLVAHAHESEQKKFREAFTQIYSYFHAVDRTLDALNKRIQMLELRIAKDHESGHS